MSTLDEMMDEALAAEYTRENSLDTLRQARAFAEYKIFGNGNLNDVDREKVRVKYLNVIIRACNAERQMLKDKNLDELAEEVERLKEERSGEEYRLK